MNRQEKLLLAVLVLSLMLILLSSGCSTSSFHNDFMAVEGSLDLTQWQKEEGVVNLDGQWEFYWQEFLDPLEIKNNPSKDGFKDLPKAWNGYIINNESLSGDGYASYRLTFQKNADSRLGIKIPRLFTSYNFWANGELIASAGTPGPNREATTPQYLPQAAFFEAQQGNNELIIHISNFHHRSGGVLESLTIGSEKQILDRRLKSIAYEIFLFGSLMIIGIYHLALYAFRKKDYSPLYFGIFCILVGIRTVFVGEIFFIYLFPGFSWEAAHKIQTLTFYLGLPLIIMFINSTFPDQLSSKIVRIVQLFGAAFGILVLFTPARIFTVFNPLYQLFALPIIMYTGYSLIRIMTKKKTGTIFIIAGALVMIVTTLNDLIFLSIWMSDQGPSFWRTFIRSGNLSSFGQLFFVFTYSLALAQKFSNAFKKEEESSRELKNLNDNLDDLIQKRTAALEESRQKIEQQNEELEKNNESLQLLTLKDPLTGLWNRRHFDSTLELEWRRCLRQDKPISLMIIDIDHFKSYNDFYGHQAGDNCLQLIAQTINNSFNRAGDLVARYGGEEFVILIPETEKEEALGLANSLCESILKLNIPHEPSMAGTCVTISAGVTTQIPDSCSSSEDLLLKADKALYQAKAAGRSQVMFLSA